MFDANVEVQATLHADVEYPKESCGFVIDGKYLPRNNCHPEPEDHFLISSQGYIAAERKGKIQAVIHSHPNGMDRPSYDDLVEQLRMEIPWGIIPKNEKLFWFGDQVPIPPLEGRIFRYGVTDCFTLVRDFYRLELGITIDFVPTDWNWWKNGENHYLDNAVKAGFFQVTDKKDWQVGDILLGAIQSKVNNHAAIYLGNSMILHHMVGRLSIKELINRYVDLLPIRWRYKK